MKEPFVRYKEDGEDRADSFTVRLNKKEREKLEECKNIIQQERDSTAIKQLALGIAPIVLHDQKLLSLLKIALNNYRKNKRLGIVTFDDM